MVGWLVGAGLVHILTYIRYKRGERGERIKVQQVVSPVFLLLPCAAGGVIALCCEEKHVLRNSDFK